MEVDTMHAPGHIRDPLIEAFQEYGADWWKAFASAQEAFRALGRLWNCTDTVPSDMRDDAAGWLELVGQAEEAKALRAGCSYAQLVRRLKPALQWVLETGYEPPDVLST